MKAETPEDSEPEPYLVRGEWRWRRVPVWEPAVSRVALCVASHLDAWEALQPDPGFEVVGPAGFQFRHNPPTLFRVPLAVVPGRVPAFESDWVPGLPVLVVEVAFGPEPFGDLWERMHEYEAAGIPVVWVLTPDFETMTVHRLGQSALGLNKTDVITGEPALPGFSARVADFFR